MALAIPAFVGKNVCLCQFFALGMLDFLCSCPWWALDFSLAKLVQAVFCKYWSLAPDSYR